MLGGSMQHINLMKLELDFALACGASLRWLESE